MDVLNKGYLSLEGQKDVIEHMDSMTQARNEILYYVIECIKPLVKPNWRNPRMFKKKKLRVSTSIDENGLELFCANKLKQKKDTFIAKCDIPPGTLLYASNPLFVVRKVTTDDTNRLLSVSEIANIVYASNLWQRQVTQYRSMRPMNPEDASKDSDILWKDSIYKTDQERESFRLLVDVIKWNAFTTGIYTIVFDKGSLFRHSCFSANCDWTIAVIEGSPILRIVTNREIKNGELVTINKTAYNRDEITPSYIVHDLKELYCNCKGCIKEIQSIQKNKPPKN